MGRKSEKQEKEGGGKGEQTPNLQCSIAAVDKGKGKAMVNKTTNLEYEDPGDKDAEDVDDGEQKTERAEDGGLRRHVTAVDILVVVTAQLGAP